MNFKLCINFVFCVLIFPVFGFVYIFSVLLFVDIL